MRTYYVLFTCNIWKEHGSREFIGVFTEKKVKSQIKKLLKGEWNIEFYDAAGLHDRESRESFWEEFKEMDLKRITTAVPIIDIIPIRINEVF